jgi:ubiquinone/menaquinone biosynthesis C-methylase UbiE
VTQPPPTQGLSFDAAADVYERARPSYPPAAVEWLVPQTARRVLDLGAGTGKLTRQLVAGGLEVVAVEPLPAMRALGEQAAPGATFLEGTAEQIPLPDDSVDAVVVAQAWHWVDPDRAVPEVARVLRPGGRLGLVWNDRDERVDWVRQLGAIMHRDAEPPDLDQPRVGPPFTDVERHEVEWQHLVSVTELLEMVTSRSYYITATTQRQAETLTEVRKLLAAHPDTSGRELVELPYVTRCYRAASTGMNC